MSNSIKQCYCLLAGILMFVFPSLAFTDGDPPRRVLALVVGVADYQDKEINDLQFSDDDALAFYSFLTGKAGGEVDSANIRLLLNERATVANIYNAKRWLETSARKNDLVFIYFAGHGDRESSIFELGFLLAYDTPHKNYLNNALRLEDFNDMATTLSVRIGAEVVIVTDACHSGTLSGIDKVHQTSLVQEQLIKATSNEIRIASCMPDQLSQENEAWGGGRGLFSYYFLFGLKGLADQNNDGRVSLSELRKYVISHVEDQIHLFDLEDQNPVIEGREEKIMSQVIDSVKAQALKIEKNGRIDEIQSAVSRSVTGISLTRAQKFVGPLQGQKLLEEYDFFKLSKAGRDAFLNLCIEKYGESEGSDNRDHWSVNNNARSELRQELAAVIHDQVQELINIYLEGDEARMEERRYYNSHLPGYDEVVPMIEVAMGMLEKDHPLYRILEVKKYYFEGLVARLKVPAAKNVEELLDKALKNQNKAHELEPKAAYITNELGVIHQLKNQNSKAIGYFKEAISQSSRWPIPYANLANAYAKAGDFKPALDHALKSKELKPDLVLAAFSLGNVYQSMSNLLYAEEEFRKSLKKNDRHFYPYENLGILYAKMTDYALADSFLYESALRKLNTNYEPGSTFPLLDTEADGVADFHVIEPNVPEPYIDTSAINPGDYMALFYWGHRFHFSVNNYSQAIKIWNRAIVADPDNPIIYHYLARAYYKLGKYEETEFMLKNAMKYYLEKDAFDAYVTEDFVSQKYRDPSTATALFLVGYFSDLYYHGRDNVFLLADIYENQGQYREAEVVYKNIINHDTLIPSKKMALVIMTSIFEDQEQWEAAEAFVNTYGGFDPEFAENELAGLYERAALANPTEGRWWYSRGMLLRSRDNRNPSHYPSDSFTDNGKMDFLREEDFVNVVYPVIDITNRMVVYEAATKTPKKDAIEAFKKALPLFRDDVIRGEINFMIGELYVKAGSRLMAWPYFEEAVQRQPEQASYRMAAIENQIPFFENKAAFHHLKKLDADSTLSYPLRKHLMKFSLMAGDYDGALKHLNYIEGYYPFDFPEKELYPALASSLQKKYHDAVAGFKSMLKGRNDDSEILYTLALMYGRNRDITLAKSYLTKALEAGFNHVFVLVQEPLWREIFGSSHWRKAIKVKRTPKEYEKSDLLKSYY